MNQQAQLTTLECEARRVGRVKRLMNRSKLPLGKSWDSFEFGRVLLTERYERGSVLLTSNLAFSKWDQIFKDTMTTAAAIDRLVHHSVIIELNVPSYRVETAKKSNASPASPKP